MAFNLENTVAGLKQASIRLDEVIDRERDKYSKLGKHLDFGILAATRPASHVMQDQLNALHRADSVSRQEIEQLVNWLASIIHETLSPAVIPVIQTDRALSEAGLILSGLTTGALKLEDLPLRSRGSIFDKLTDAFEGISGIGFSIIQGGGNLEKQQSLAYLALHMVSTALHNVVDLIEKKGIPGNEFVGGALTTIRGFRSRTEC